MFLDIVFYIGSLYLFKMASTVYEKEISFAATSVKSPSVSLA